MALGKSASVIGLIVFGTTTSLFAKIVYELESVGRHGDTKLFAKPWAMTTVMFIGMSFLLPLAFIQDAKKRQKATELEEPLLGYEQGAHQHSLIKEIGLLCLPTVFDLIATVLMNVGLMSVTASVYQMMRGAEMIFAAVFAVLFLHRRLNKFHLLGILLCTIGIALVGTSSLLSGEGSSTRQVSKAEMLLGMGLIVMSQAVQAAQLTFEDFFMADLNMAAMKIVGYEGVLGSLMMIGVLLPVVYFCPGAEGNGLREDTWDTLVMIANSHGLLIVLLVDMFALCMYNLSGMSVTGHLGAVFRTVLETMRTLFVWLIGLLLFYTPLGMGKLGESWSVWSYLQAAGFCVLVSGTLVYGRGDEEGAKAELQEAVSAALAPADPSAEVPVPPAASMPVAMRHSVTTAGKATMTMNAESLSRSLGRASFRSFDGPHVDHV